MTKLLRIEASIAKELSIPESHACVVGSTLICGKGNDVDILCLVPSESCVLAAGFEQDCSAIYESFFRSYRRDGQNIIATMDQRFFFAEVAIAHAAKILASDGFDMTRRSERVRFHSGVRVHVQARMNDLIAAIEGKA